MNVSRKQFIGDSIKLVIAGSIPGIIALSGCHNKEGEEKDVSPPEDLMQEHGLLNRLLLIYDACKGHILNSQRFPNEALAGAANIIRTFVEDYHEKQEENYLFPRFSKAGQLTDLVDTLLKQHNAGRAITDRIMQLTASQNRSATEDHEIVLLITGFNNMYRPHEAREDTVLFPAFRKIVSRHEYDSLGEEFENNEHKLFGQDGFESMVSKVAAIENQLGIYDLGQFTPAI